MSKSLCGKVRALSGEQCSVVSGNPIQDHKLQPYCFGLRTSPALRLDVRILPFAYNRCGRILFLPFVFTFPIPFQSTFGTQNLVELTFSSSPPKSCCCLITYDVGTVRNLLEIACTQDP